MFSLCRPNLNVKMCAEDRSSDRGGEGGGGANRNFPRRPTVFFYRPRSRPIYNFLGTGTSGAGRWPERWQNAGILSSVQNSIFIILNSVLTRGNRQETLRYALL